VTPKSLAHQWVLFITSGDKDLLREISQRQQRGVSRYRIHEINAVVGKAPSTIIPDWDMVRIECDAPIQLPEIHSQSTSISPIVTFHGITQNLHYTSLAQRQELEATSRTEIEGSNETTAVLIPIGKSLKWWRLAQDQRQAHFQTGGEYRGHTAIGAPYTENVFRKLYHSRYTNPPAPYDFLTYFEFKNSHMVDFKELLTELRDTSRNPEWAYVEFEYEIWMTKIASS